MSLIFWILFIFVAYKAAETDENDCVPWGTLTLLCGILASYLLTIK